MSGVREHRPPDVLVLLADRQAQLDSRAPGRPAVAGDRGGLVYLNLFSEAEPYARTGLRELNVLHGHGVSCLIGSTCIE